MVLDLNNALWTCNNVDLLSLPGFLSVLLGRGGCWLPGPVTPRGTANPSFIESDFTTALVTDLINIVTFIPLGNFNILINNLCKFKKLEQNFKKWFCTYSKLVLNVRFKDFWYAKINLTQIWYDEFNEYLSN